MRNKILFINADAEYAEGKAQNRLRPEDLGKIGLVFHEKRELSQYSRLVDLQEIQDNDYNLNIRRYVDNSPPEKPEDVRAHLVGGIPWNEVEPQLPQFKKFKIRVKTLFTSPQGGYAQFHTDLQTQAQIKPHVEALPPLKTCYQKMHRQIADWWESAQRDFSRLAPQNQTKQESPPKDTDLVQEPMSSYLSLGGKRIPKIRKTLLASLRDRLLPLGVLDEFQVVGTFVNWWLNIKIDLKTISSIGWYPGLIPDAYLLETYFKKEEKRIEELENKMAERQIAIEEELEKVEYDPEEGENMTARVIKDFLKKQIKEITETLGKERKEIPPLKEHLAQIERLEKENKKFKQELNEIRYWLQFKLEMKRYGKDELCEEQQHLLDLALEEICSLEEQAKALLPPAVLVEIPQYQDLNDLNQQITRVKKEKKALLQDLKTLEKGLKPLLKKWTPLDQDRKPLENHLQKLKQVYQEIGGMISPQESQILILKKIFEQIHHELTQYLNNEKRNLITSLEQLWEKYSVSMDQLNLKANTTQQSLEKYFSNLEYLKK